MLPSEKSSPGTAAGHRGSSPGPKGWYSRNYLPHFDGGCTVQHITYRLADALPSNALLRMQQEVEALQKDDEAKSRELRRRIEEHLDAGHGSCILREPEIARLIIDNWRHFHGERYKLLAWVVMPNHCHVLIEPLGGFSLGRIVLSWKSYTARRINAWKRLQKEAGRGGPRQSREEEEKSRGGPRRSQAEEECRGGPRQSREEDKSRGGPRRSQPEEEGRRSERVWQREYWDRFIRDEQHFDTARWYIESNPVKAGLAARPEDWPFSSAAVGDKG